jgi:hypothetical protein
LRYLVHILVLALLSTTAAAQQQGIWGERGISRRFVLRDALLFAADGRGVSVYDVSNPAVIARLDVESGDAETFDLALAGDSELVVATSQGIDRFARNGGTLNRLPSLEVKGGTSRIAATATRVLAASDRTLLILARAPNGLAIQHQIPFTQAIRALAVSGSIVFVAVERTSIFAVDINSGATINPIAVDAVDLAVSGSTLWAASELRGLFAIDIATQTIKGVVGGGQLRLTRVAASGSRVYAIEAPDRVHIFDGSKPAEPKLLASMTDWAEVIAAGGTRVYLAGAIIDAQGLSYETGAPVRIYEASDPGVPALLGEFRDLAGPVSGVATDGSIAYVIDSPYLRVLDISTTTEPKEIASIVVPGIQDHIRVRNGLAINYGRIYVNLIDVADPRKPKILTRWFTQGGGAGYAALLRDTFVEANEYSGLHIVDYSNLAQPVQIAGRIFHYLDVVAGDDVVYTIQPATFLTIDLTDRTKVVDRVMYTGRYLQLDTMPANTAFPHHVVLRSGTGVWLYSVIEDRFLPRPLGFVPLDDIDIFATSNTSVFAEAGGRIHRLDVPGASAFVETDMVATSPMQMAASGEKLVIADRYRLRIYGPDTPPPPPPPPPVPVRRRAVAH